MEPKPRSLWKYHYERCVLQSLECLLQEMNTSAANMEERYRDFLSEREQEYKDSWETPELIKEDFLADSVLNGIGTALIIGTDTLIQSVKRYDDGRPAEKPIDQEYRHTPWENAIIAAGNYVRHSHEWHMLYLNFIKENTVPAIFPNERKALVERFLADTKSKNKKAEKSLRFLHSFGINLDEFLFPSAGAWKMAKLTHLNDEEYTMKMMCEFLDSHHNLRC